MRSTRIMTAVVAVASTVLALGVSTLPARADVVAPPAPPTNLSVLSVVPATHTIRLGWTKSVSTDVVGYDVYRGDIRETGTSSSTTVTLTNVPGGTWVFTVAARNSAGLRSVRSNAVSVTLPKVTTAVPAPKNLLAPNKSLMPTSALLTWDPVILPLSSSSILPYPIFKTYQVMQDGVFIASSTSSSATITDLKPLTTYRFTVRVLFTDGSYTVDSDPYLVKTPDTTARPYLPAPVSLRVLSTTSTTIRLGWTVVTNSIPPGFDVFIRGERVEGTRGAMSVTVTGLKPATAYGPIVVREHDNNGVMSDPSNAVFTQTTQPPIASPKDVTIDLEGKTSAKLHWTGTAGTGGIYYLVVNGAEIAKTQDSWIRLTGLKPGSSYKVSVIAQDAKGGRSEPSTPVLVTTKPSTWVPDAPTRCTAQLAILLTAGGTAGSILPAPNPIIVVCDMLADPAVEGITAYVDGAGVNGITTGTSPLHTYAITLKGTELAKGGTLTVRSSDFEGDSSVPTKPITVPVVGKDTGAPEAPSVAGSWTAPLQRTIVWSVARDDLAIEHYELLRDGYPIGVIEPDCGGATSPTDCIPPTGVAHVTFGPIPPADGFYTYTDSSSIGGATHTYQVVAFDTAGNRTVSDKLVLQAPPPLSICEKCTAS